MKRLICFLLLSSSLLYWNGCHSHDHGEDGHAHESSPAAEEHDDKHAELSPIQMEKIGLELHTLESKNLQFVLKVNGQLELPPQNEASVSTISPGMIQKINVRPGQYVKKGQVLASLRHPDFIDLQQKYLETEGQLLYLDKEYARQKKLTEQEIAPVKQLEKVISDQAVAQAVLKGLKAKMQLLGIPVPSAASSNFTSQINIHSPISGNVRNIHVNIGEYVNPQQEIFEIVDNHHIHIDLLVYEKDLHHIHVGQKINFFLQSDPKSVMEAKVFAIGKALEEEQHAVRVHAEIDNVKGDLLPGMYVEARIILNDQAVDALPEEAITTDKGLYYIFIKEHLEGEAMHFRKVQVVLGTRDMGYVAVTPLEKLADSTLIATQAAYYLMAQTKKDEGGGHSHSH